MAEAIESQFEAIGHPKFVVHLTQVVLYNLLGGSHPNRNLFILHTLSNAGHNQRFLGRELDFGARSRWAQAMAAKCFHDPMNGLVL